ncbi:MAG: FAD-dependent oxidoreductase [Deltaproteobacteria bacterium]|nr:FAD-dependent oxidoreductase [Deltaproteobacteria bacterium]
MKAIKDGDFRGLPISRASTAVNMTGSWKFFRPHLVSKNSPCREACPLQIPIAAYLGRLAEGKPSAALALLREFNPMPAVTGRVCPNFCQNACNRMEFDEAVSVGELERYLGDLGLEQAPDPVTVNRTEKIAIIGAGPAGLSAATFLARRGFKITLFEQAPAAGGLLRYAIPAYRLPRAILNREIDNLLKSYQIDLKCECRIGPDETSQLATEYSRIIWAPGLQSSRLPAAWPRLPLIKGALEVLSAISRGADINGQRFLVVGGGNAALDTARSLRRLGKEVEIIYRRTLAEMPAYAAEIKQALAEGLVIHTEEVIENVKPLTTGLQLFIHKSRKINEQIGAGEFLRTATADCLIAAIGQESDLRFNEHNNFITAGDFAHGAASVAEALASGRRAAETVLQQLGILPVPENITPDLKSKSRIEYKQLQLDYYAKKPAVKMAELDSLSRKENFSEIHQTLSSEQMQIEIERCFHCGSCTACGICWFFCPDVAIALDREESDLESRVLFDYDHCKGCGQCAAICPRGVIEMEEDN